MSRQLEVLIHGLGHNDLAASSRVLLRQVLRKRKDVWERFYVRIWWRQALHRGSGKTAVSSFSTIFSWSPPSVGGGRRFWQNYISSKSSSGWTNTFKGDQEKRVLDAEQFARGAGDVSAQVCGFVLFIGWHFVFRLWMYLTLSDVDICKAKEEGLKKLLKEYRFSKDVYRYPWLIIDDLLIQ